MSSERAVHIGGIAFPAIVLTGLLTYGLSLMRAGLLEASETEPMRVSVIGEQWWWRVEYLGRDTRIPAANEIRIPAGRTIEFELGAVRCDPQLLDPGAWGKVRHDTRPHHQPAR